MDLAIEQFTKAITVDPHAARPHVNLAIAYLRQGLFADAEQAARRAVDLDRVGRYGRLVLGVSSIMTGSAMYCRRNVELPEKGCGWRDEDVRI